MSARPIAPAAASAEYSPSEWPATKAARLDGNAELAVEHAHRRHADRHQRRLGVLGQGQRLDRPLAHELEQSLAEGVVDLLEHLAGGGEGVGKFDAHADGLAALTREHEGETHGRKPLGRFSRRALGERRRAGKAALSIAVLSHAKSWQ